MTNREKSSSSALFTVVPSAFEMLHTEELCRRQQGGLGTGLDRRMNEWQIRSDADPAVGSGCYDREQERE